MWHCHKNETVTKRNFFNFHFWEENDWIHVASCCFMEFILCSGIFEHDTYSFMVWVTRIMQLMFHFLHIFSNIMVKVVDAIATIRCRLLYNLLEILAHQYPCQIILHLSINVKVSADHCWSLWGYPLLNELSEPVFWNKLDKSKL